MLLQKVALLMRVLRLLLQRERQVQLRVVQIQVLKPELLREKPDL